MEASDTFATAASGTSSPIGLSAGDWWFLATPCDSADDINQALRTLSRQANYMHDQHQAYRKSVTKTGNVD